MTARDALGVTPTPDTGERLSTVRLWDEATRPTGPQPPPGAAYSAHGRAVPATLSRSTITCAPGLPRSGTSSARSGTPQARRGCARRSTR
jgi:hypothetical protein